MSCQTRVATTSFVIPTTDHVVWRTTVCGNKATTTVTTDDGDSQIPICSSCVKRYVTKHKENSTWLGWFDGSVPNKAPVFDSHWFWWRVYEAWLAQSGFEDKTRQVSRKELLDWIRPSMFIKQPDPVSDLTEKLSSCSISTTKQTFQEWLQTPEGQKATMKQRIQKHKEMHAA